MTRDPAYGWAFLVARGRRRGYQSLLMPDFLVQSNEYGVLGQTASGDSPADGEPRVAELTGLAAGDVTFVCVTERLTPADLEGSPVAGPVTDEFGRPLELLYGFACRGAVGLEIDAADLGAARAEALRTYQRFLADESGFAVVSSQAFVLRSRTTLAQQQQPVLEPAPAFDPPAPYLLETPAGQAVPVHHQPVPRKSRLAPLLAGAGIVAVSLIAWLVLVDDDAKITRIAFIEPSTSEVFCTAPVTVRATVSADGPATIKYHWETNGKASAPIEQAIDEGDTTLEARLDLGAAAGRRVDLTQTLVIDEPTAATATHEYHLICK
ncbi:hypothetical protein [Kribbella sp. CA-294648]|uniref:hypothetical protein n=1 Tax=Kribbella sp. CA-294648 TaxID=3239948 RepID=UPI003D930D2C